MIVRRAFFAFALSFWGIYSSGCQPDAQQDHQKVTNSVEQLETLAQYMTGSFSSAAQAAADSDYFDISLHMYPIWPQRADAKWLYVEQALSTQQEAPYRQRVYKVEALPDGRFASHVFTLPHPESFVGAWQDSAGFSGISPDSLADRSGCTVFLAADGAAFSGATHEADCGSELRGASYATSKVSVFADRIESWDQGFDSAGVQVWGAEKGGYRFDRVKK